MPMTTDWRNTADIARHLTCPSCDLLPSNNSVKPPKLMLNMWWIWTSCRTFWWGVSLWSTYTVHNCVCICTPVTLETLPYVYIIKKHLCSCNLIKMYDTMHLKLHVWKALFCIHCSCYKLCHVLIWCKWRQWNSHDPQVSHTIRN